MAVKGERLLKSYKVASATGTDHVIGYMDAANSIARASATGQTLVGVIENNPTNSSDIACVCIAGATKVHAGTGAISRGNPLTVDSRGYAIASTAANKDNIVGYADEASTADGQLIAVRINPEKIS